MTARRVYTQWPRATRNHHTQIAIVCRRGAIGYRLPLAQALQCCREFPMQSRAQKELIAQDVPANETRVRCKNEYLQIRHRHITGHDRIRKHSPAPQGLYVRSTSKWAIVFERQLLNQPWNSPVNIVCAWPVRYTRSPAHSIVSKPVRADA
jgi:hypothetical protein